MIFLIDLIKIICANQCVRNIHNNNSIYLFSNSAFTEII